MIVMSPILLSIRDAARSRGLTITGLGRIVGLDKATVSRAFSGHTDPSLSTVERLASAAGVSVVVEDGGAGELLRHARQLADDDLSTVTRLAAVVGDLDDGARVSLRAFLAYLESTAADRIRQRLQVVE